MKPNFENRDITRFEHESAVTLENKKTGVQCPNFTGRFI
jgi:hypothetical protein